MQYRRFGKTELQIPVFSCGGMRYQQSWKDADPVTAESQANLEATIRRSLEVGINHIETARGYGTSEVQLGKILPTLKRDDIIVQTKVSPYADPKQFQATFDKSMSLLKLDHVDLFAFHGVNNETYYEHMLACMETAQRWKREGRVRHVGFSTHGHCSIIQKAIATGALDYVNLHWYYIFQDNWPAVLDARARDMGVFIISPNDKGGLLYKPSAKLIELCQPLHPMVFNALFCLSHDEVHTLSCGAARPEDFDIHLSALPLLDEAKRHIAPVIERLETEMTSKLGGEWVQSWQQGLPEWDATPGEINIPVILRLRNLALAYDMVEYGKMRYNLLGNADHWFPGNRAEKAADLDLAPALKASPFAEKIPAYLAETHALLKGQERKRLQEA